MTDKLKTIIAQLNNEQGYAPLRQFKHGLEKEALRVDLKGNLAQTPHPQALGSALTHPYITTDYSEALLELITPPLNSIDDMLAFLKEVHVFVAQSLDNELIWTSSMPCHLADELSIPIAQFGSSNLGKLKHVYRCGLWHRYGRMMQAIAGIHYNFSFPLEFWPVLQSLENNSEDLKDFRSARYFSVIRNFRRYAWLLYYLFGATPVVDRSFLDGKSHQLQNLNTDTLYAPYATSLRMSNIGYNNSNQSHLKVCHNSLVNYVSMLAKATQTSHPDYEALGIQKNGTYLQLNTHTLQIANEYYSSIRPKAIGSAGQTPIQALQTNGVEYIEVRGVDINPFLPLGINKQQAQFMDVFLLFCALQDSQPMSDAEYNRIAHNHNLIVNQGRDPNLLLENELESVSVPQWGHQLLDALLLTAQLLNNAHGNNDYTQAVDAQRIKLTDASQTPSAQILAQLKQENISFAQWAQSQALHTAQFFARETLSPEKKKYYQQLANTSLAEQLAIEASDATDFEQYRQAYVAAL